MLAVEGSRKHTKKEKAIAPAIKHLYPRVTEESNKIRDP
jgi:hypothetical protein